MLIYVFIGLLALWMGFLVGQQAQWERWHGPVGSVIVIPIALALGFNPLISVIGPVALGSGFALARLRS